MEFMRCAFVFVIIVLTVVFQSEAGVNKDKRPNIIFIMADDHATPAISSYGSQLINTPNIDRLSEQGMRFNHAFVTSSLCAPSRAAILSGKYGEKSGFKRIGDSFDGTGNTLPNLLQKSGFETAIFGKWHLHSKPLGFDFVELVKRQGKFFNPKFFNAENIKV